ncbi:hypothetical protein D047_1784B, partial [Vibrio parahaemolyticus VPTS-2010_2]
TDTIKPICFGSLSLSSSSVFKPGTPYIGFAMWLIHALTRYG